MGIQMEYTDHAVARFIARCAPELRDWEARTLLQQVQTTAKTIGKTGNGRTKVRLTLTAIALCAREHGRFIAVTIVHVDETNLLR